jgi:hypothetical protein
LPRPSIKEDANDYSPSNSQLTKIANQVFGHDNWSHAITNQTLGTDTIISTILGQLGHLLQEIFSFLFTFFTSPPRFHRLRYRQVSGRLRHHCKGATERWNFSRRHRVLQYRRLHKRIGYSKVQDGAYQIRRPSSCYQSYLECFINVILNPLL